MNEEIIHFENNNTKNLKVINKMPSGYLDRIIYIYKNYLAGRSVLFF